MDSISDQKYVPVPQWKQDLIARLKNGTNKPTLSSTVEAERHCDHSPQVSVHPEAIVSSRSASDVVVMSRCLSSAQWNVSSSKSVKSSDMVSESHRENCKHSFNLTEEQIDHQFCQNGEDSDSDDLHYGPGIVKKLKNKYLSLALRESNSRPSILHLRKATSLENVLEDDIYIGNKQFQSQVSHRKKAIPNRYRGSNRPEIKRARSVETISKLEDVSATVTNTFNRQSFHEDLLIDLHTENNTFVKNSQDNNQFIERTLESKYNNSYCNRPKKIQPIVNDNEKPPPEFVKQAKKIFERRPEQRTRPPVQTGDVAAKVHNFNNIIVKAKVEAKVSKKLSNKHKPVSNDKNKSSIQPVISKRVDEADQNRYMKKNNDMRKEPSLPSPIPDVSMIEFPKNRDNDNNKNNSLSETPDLILTSSPVSNVSLMKGRNTLGNSVFNKEIRNPDHLLDNNVTKKFTSPVLSPTSVKPASPLLMPSPNRSLSPLYRSLSPSHRPLSPSHMPLSPTHSPLSPLRSLTKSPNAQVDNQTETDNKTNFNLNESELEVHSNFKADLDVPLLQTLNVDINEFDDTQTLSKSRYVARSPPKFSPPPPPETDSIKTEIENLKNSARTVEAKGVEVINKNVLVRKTVPREQSATTVFNFTNRKDVPDYISNDQSRTPLYPKLPKVSAIFLLLLGLFFIEYLLI